MGDSTRLKPWGRLLRGALVASGALGASYAQADDSAACISYADNVAKVRAADAEASARYFSGEYARAFVTRFDAIIGGAPDGVATVASISAHLHPSNGSQAVDVRFYGSNGCDLGPGATLAISLYSAIIQQIGSGA